MTFVVINIKTRSLMGPLMTQNQATELANRLNKEAGTRVCAVVNLEKRRA